MKTRLQQIIVLAFSCFILNIKSYSQTFTTLATDVATDVGNYPGLPDGGTFSYYYNSANDTIWFRVSIISYHSTTAFGMNVFIDTDNNQTTGSAWWGSAPQNPTFTYEKYITAWVSGGPNFTGTIGIGDHAGELASNYNNLLQNNIIVQSDAITKTFTLGVKRSDIGAGITSMNVMAVVGTNMSYNDAIPNTGVATITFTGIDEQNNSFNIQTYPVPATEKITIKGLEKGAIAGINIFNILGESVYSSILETNNGQATEINVSTLATGTYILQVIQNGLAKTDKVIISRN